MKCHLAPTVVILLLIIVSLTGCGGFGPLLLQGGRVNYNKVIEQTSKQQTFINIVRVSNNEPMLFMEVLEVDATFLVQGSATGGETGIGARAGTTGGTLAGPVGAAGGTLEFQETPTIRYQPLQGQPLVEQISTPITVATITKLFDSEWPIGAILGLAVDRLTPNLPDFAAALNAINSLDEYGVLVLAPNTKSKSAPASSGEPGANIMTVIVQTGQGTGSTGDTLDIYLQRGHPSLIDGQTLEEEGDQISNCGRGCVVCTPIRRKT
jgi:predicted small lipoprotein YifL